MFGGGGQHFRFDGRWLDGVLAESGPLGTPDGHAPASARPTDRRITLTIPQRVPPNTPELHRLRPHRDHSGG